MKYFRKNWNINEGKACNWATEGAMCMSRAPYFRCMLALSLLGLTWLIVQVEFVVYRRLPWDLESKCYIDWNFNVGFRKGNGLQFFRNLLR